MAVAPAVRGRAVRALAAHLPPVLAHALEHACHVRSMVSGVSYERAFFRALHLLETGHLDSASLMRLGPHAVVGAPLEALVGRIPQREAMRVREQAQAASRALLRDLTQGEIADIPDAGLKCKKCQSNDITYEFLQTRSADEGTTIFCTCGRCRKRWKM